MPLRLDHVVIAVNDLNQAMVDFGELGFIPFHGGVHVGGKTHNALIIFQDGTYLELLAPTSPTLLDNLKADDGSNFLFLFAEGEGLVAYALSSDNLEADVRAMQERRVAVTLRPTSGRARPDGQQLQWRAAMLDNGSMCPFFIQDITPRALRVPDDQAVTTQPNGVSGIRCISVPTDQLGTSLEHYQAMLGTPPQALQQNSARFVVGEVKILLSAQSSSALHLSEVQLIGQHTMMLDLQRTHGAALSVVSGAEK